MLSSSTSSSIGSIYFSSFGLVLFPRKHIPKQDVICFLKEFFFLDPCEISLLRPRRLTKPRAGSLGWVDCSLSILRPETCFDIFALAGEDIVNLLSLCSLWSPTFNSSDTRDNLLPPGVGPKSSLRLVSCLLMLRWPGTSRDGLMTATTAVSVGSWTLFGLKRSSSSVKSAFGVISWVFFSFSSRLRSSRSAYS